MRFSDRLMDEGVFAQPVVFPTVALDLARLRTIVTAAHSEAQLDRALGAFSTVGRELGVVSGMNRGRGARGDHDRSPGARPAARRAPPHGPVARQRRTHRRLRRGGRRARASPSWRSRTTSTSTRRAGLRDSPRSTSASAACARRLNAGPSCGVAIRFGVEITWDRRWATDIREHLARHAYDFVIGSVHIYRDSPYAAERRRELGRRSVAAPRSSRPTSTRSRRPPGPGCSTRSGHIDFVKRYLAPHVTAADLAAAPELYEPILRAPGGDRHGAGDQHQRAALSRPRRRIPSPADRRRCYRGDRRAAPSTSARTPTRADAFAWGLADGYESAADGRIRRRSPSAAAASASTVPVTRRT